MINCAMFPAGQSGSSTSMCTGNQHKPGEWRQILDRRPCRCMRSWIHAWFDSWCLVLDVFCSDSLNYGALLQHLTHGFSSLLFIFSNHRMLFFFEEPCQFALTSDLYRHPYPAVHLPPAVYPCPPLNLVGEEKIAISPPPPPTPSIQLSSSAYFAYRRLTRHNHRILPFLSMVIEGPPKTRTLTLNCNKTIIRAFYQMFSKTA